MNENTINKIMLLVNTLMINVAAGAGLGYDRLLNSPNAVYYLSGNWHINADKYGRTTAWTYYILTELWFIQCGSLAAALLYWLHPSFPVAYL
jgi:hypothetical protein